jgi:D-3-phosphoglycerate dehydrogenase
VLNQKRILLPTSMAAEGVALIAARPELHITRYDPAIAPAELHALLADSGAIALSWTRFRAAEIAAAPGLEVVARLGVGFDAVEVAALTARGLPLMTAGTANARSVAEHAVHLIFALAKKSAEMHRRMRTGEGHDRLSGLPGEVAGKTVLVVGFGRIGSRVAPRCKALEMEVLVHDPYVAAETIRAAGYEPAPDLDAALPRADYVTLHCPKTPETIGLLDAPRLARLRRGACVINTARGGIVDEAALTAALRSGHIAGAGLDVFDPEPPDPANPLLHMETVFASPHIAGVTSESWSAIGVVAAQNILSVLDGAPTVAHAVNPQVFGSAEPESEPGPGLKAGPG